MKPLVKVILCFLLFGIVFLFSTFVSDKIDKWTGYYNQGILDSQALKESYIESSK